MSERNTLAGMFVNTLVRDQYGRLGLVAETHRECPEDESWIRGQSIPVTDDDRADYWITVHPLDGGSTVQPAGSLTVVMDAKHVAAAIHRALLP